MSMARRSFLLSTAAFGALAFAVEVEARGLHGGSPSGAPPAPGTIPVSFNNVSTGSSYLQPIVSFVQPFADGDVPGTGSVTAKDSSGSPVTVQMDQIATWPSGYMSGAVLTIPMSETCAAGSTKNYTLTTSTSARNTALPAGWSGAPNAAAPDIKCIYSGGDAGSNTYTVSLRTILANYSTYPWGTSYPKGGWEVTKSGPNCVEWHAWQFLINDSTGFTQGYVRCDMWVKAISPTGPYEIDVRTSMPNMWNTVATDSELYNQNAGRFAANLQVKNGSTVISYQGGPNTLYYTQTLAPSAFNTSTQVVSLSNSASQTGYVITSTGSIPAGLTAGKVYWPSGGKLYNQRTFLGFVEVGSVADAWAANTTYGSYFNYVQNNGIIYFAFSPGTSGNSGGPTGQGGTDGTMVWEAISPVFTSQGSGTITMSPIYSCFGGSAWMAADLNGDPIWSGSGTKPRIFPGHDFNYLAQRSKAVPPFNINATAQTTNQTNINFGPNQLYGGLIWHQDDTGDNPGDQRVGYVDNWGVVALYSPKDPYYTTASIQSALSWTLFQQNFFGDERNGLPFAGNNGPANDGVPYTNFPTPQPGWVQNNRVDSRTFGLGNYAPWTANSQGMSGLAGGQTYGNFSHTPCPMQVPYLKTGRTCFMDHMVHYANANAISSYNNYATFGGKATYSAINNNGSNQLRAWGWMVRSLSRGLYFAADGHPFKQVLASYYNDHYAYQAYAATNMPANAKPLGILAWLDHGGSPGGYSPWMYHYLDYAICMDQWCGGLTAASKADISTLFNYVANHYNTYVGGNNIYYGGVYDFKYSPDSQGFSTSYTAPAAAVAASFGPSGIVGVAYPAPAGAINDVFSNAGAPNYPFDGATGMTAYAVIFQSILKLRALADPANSTIAALLAAAKTDIASHTGVSATNGGLNWSYTDGGAIIQNYHTYPVF